MTSIIPEAARTGLEVEVRDRLDRLEPLSPEQRTAALSYLAACDGAAFDAVLDQIAVADDGADPGNSRPAETYCLLCGGPFETHDADHEPFLAWRPRTSG